MGLGENKELFSLKQLIAGRILLKDEVQLLEISQEIKKTYFSKIPSITNNGFFHECQRCLTRSSSSFAYINCKRCNNKHLYCRNCLMMGRVLACEDLYISNIPDPNWPKINNAFHANIRLTEEQSKAASFLHHSFLQKKKEVLVWAVCGSGKTEMLFPLLEKVIAKGLRICIASPRKDVVLELFPRMKQAFPKLNIQALYGGSPHNKKIFSSFIISTTHQLIRFKEAFDLLIIDEIDAFPYHNDPFLYRYAKRAIKQHALTVYLTATPRRRERRRMKLNTLPHVFIPKRFHNNPLIVPSFISSFHLQNELKQKKIPKAFLTWLDQREDQTRQLLIFVPTKVLAEKLFKNLCKEMEKVLRIDKKQIAFVHAYDEKRSEKIEQFRKGDLHILLTTTILERGVTFPSIDVFVIDAGHEVFDEQALVQIAGRAGRSKLDPFGEVIFLHDGKTKAMLRAKKEIQLMNKRGGFC